MFSSVRYPEHVRQAMLAGVQVCTVPFKVMKGLCENTLTEVGTQQFREHTALMTMRVDELIRPENPVCEANETVAAAMVKMTESRLGTVTIVDQQGSVAGIFTDGDLRRRLQSDGRAILDRSLADLGFTRDPVTVSRAALLNEAVALIKENEVDSIIVVDDTAPAGVLDIQDLVKLGLLGHEHL